MTVTLAYADARALPLPDCSVDAIVCDPPYNLAFMGKEWDRFEGAPKKSQIPSPAQAGFPMKTRGERISDYRESNTAFQAWCESWAREALRVLKPGGHLLAFGGTRTHHRLACGIEDAGFELRDTIRAGTLAWHYASGFPKSLDVSRAIDKAAGAEREVVGESSSYARALKPGRSSFVGEFKRVGPESISITAPATAAAEQWQGWGTALKPAWEPVVCARKPLSAGTVAANVQAWGTGALNIDATRVAGVPASVPQPIFNSPTGRTYGMKTGEGRNGEMSQAPGRWPPNVTLVHLPTCTPAGTRRVKSAGDRGTATKAVGGILNHIGERLPTEGTGYAGPDGTEETAAWDCQPGCPVVEIDRQSGNRPTGALKPYQQVNRDSYSGGMPAIREVEKVADQGGASRFFPTFTWDADLDGPAFAYIAKASRRERDAGLDRFPLTAVELPCPACTEDNQADCITCDGKGVVLEKGGRNAHPT